MRYSVELSNNFKKEAKRLIKKYRSIKTEIIELITELETNPTMGTPLGNEIYKIRLAIKSKGKGKRGGARVMTFVKVTGNVVLLFSIYNKGDRDSIPDVEIQQLIKEYR